MDLPFGSFLHYCLNLEGFLTAVEQMSHIALEKAAYFIKEYTVRELIFICFPKENTHFESPCLRKYWRFPPRELEVLHG